jgi:hypothetical protein
VLVVASFPHYGSNSNGTLALTLSAQITLSRNKCETIFIISSNPNEENNLPRQAVLPLLPNIPITKSHYYSCSSGRYETTSPVFITCENSITEQQQHFKILIMKLNIFHNYIPLSSKDFITSTSLKGTFSSPICW